LLQSLKRITEKVTAAMLRCVAAHRQAKTAAAAAVAHERDALTAGAAELKPPATVVRSSSTSNLASEAGVCAVTADVDDLPVGQRPASVRAPERPQAEEINLSDSLCVLFHVSLQFQSCYAYPFLTECCAWCVAAPMRCCPCARGC
jgi:hypothetical protein